MKKQSNKISQDNKISRGGYIVPIKKIVGYLLSVFRIGKLYIVSLIFIFLDNCKKTTAQAKIFPKQDAKTCL